MHSLGVSQACVYVLTRACTCVVVPEPTFPNVPGIGPSLWAGNKSPDGRRFLSHSGTIVLDAAARLVFDGTREAGS